MSSGYCLFRGWVLSAGLVGLGDVFLDPAGLFFFNLLLLLLRVPPLLCL